MIKILMAFMTVISLGSFATADTTKASAWKVVPNEEVCMVTNMHFTRPQIPVKADGKTYFGCCENCKATIQTDMTSRTATDPLTQKPVDKAKATIAADDRGAVLYFESRSNFDRYMKQLAGKTK
ncbi:hypothetical protein BDW_10305 [Bdellovibrio bacteriovorus W]|nr:hypothetical protein BDW_10305 [Bdellovibrio bacteriovorus W]